MNNKKMLISKTFFRHPKARRNFFRSVSTEHFPSDAAEFSVPSVACSAPTALGLDESFRSLNDPSGRPVTNEHSEAYKKEGKTTALKVE